MVQHFLNLSGHELRLQVRSISGTAVLWSSPGAENPGVFTTKTTAARKSLKFT